MPFEHYKSCFKALDPQEAAKRCGVSYDESGFEFKLLNECYKITWPEFSISSENPSAWALNSLSAQMLIIRYLLEGRASVGSGKFVTYREMPWGEVYVRQFTGRCITRAAFSFATRMQAFEKT
ncbi:MAG: DUF3786 domain-containing protein, partial [Clostridia bacterium]|nr:DUF3786 domain-containing protein [Clostridia bacterium]